MSGESAQAGDWVQIHWIVLSAEQRPASLPPETRAVPLEARVKGTLHAPATARPGETVTVRTATGRLVTGQLAAIHPAYAHGFGQLVPEMVAAGLELRQWGTDGGGESA